MVWPRKASSAQATGWHCEISAILLCDDVRRHLGGAEKGVEALVNRKRFGNPMFSMMIAVIPALFLFDKRNSIWAIAIDLVDGHQNERGLRAVSTAGLEQVECTDGIDIKVIEWDSGGAIVRRLRRGVNNKIGCDFLDEFFHVLTRADVHLVMPELGQGFLQAPLIPAGVSLGPE